MPKRVIKKPWGERHGGNKFEGGVSHKFQDETSKPKHYFGHDDRDRDVKNDGGRKVLFFDKPRVSFKKTSRYGMDLKKKYSNPDFERALQMDDDILMNVNNREQTSNRGKPTRNFRGRNSPLPHRGPRQRDPGLANNFRPRVQFNTDHSWYKITIPHGGKFDKALLVSTFQNYLAPDTFVPITYKVMETDAVFFVDSHDIAKKLMDAHNKITMNSGGFKLQVRLRSEFPRTIIDDNVKERLKVAMGKRYSAETNALDLSCFHRDPDIVDDYFCALFRHNMLLLILDIVFQHIPNLGALNLNQNKLRNTDKLALACKKFPQLKILYLGDNELYNIGQLDQLKDLKLDELRLVGNPFCDKYSSRHNDYVSDVRKRFPKLLRLDGVVLPPPISFDLEDQAVKVPPSKRMFIANDKAQEIASQFLQQYFQIYDSGSRQPLLSAYHSDAIFSLTIAHAGQISKFNPYLSENRNLYRVTDKMRRHKLLTQGGLQVVSYIDKLPKTTHDLNSFTMDIVLATEAMMLIEVTGMFKEMDGKDNLLRYFSRTFVIVPTGTGYCIQSEQLHISHPTQAQEKGTSVARVQSAPSYSGAPPPYDVGFDGSQPSTSGAQQPVTEDVKQQMANALCQQTNMNLEWSLKCLTEVNWNFNQALVAFQEFFKMGRIPQEAFNK